MQERRKKLLTATALIIGILLAAIAAVYLFTDFFDTTPQTDPAEQVKNADTIAPDTSLAEDTIVGHWRHYNEGSVIEKIGTASIVGPSATRFIRLILRTTNTPTKTKTATPTSLCSPTPTTSSSPHRATNPAD